MVLLRQLSYAIQNQLKAPKAPTRGISCLSLVLYGIRIGSEGLPPAPTGDQSFLAVLTLNMLFKM